MLMHQPYYSKKTTRCRGDLRPATLILLVSVSLAALVGGSGNYVYASPTTVLLITDHVAINEFEQDPPGDDRSGGEFVELYNPTQQPVDIGKWIIYTTHGDISSYEIPAGTTLLAGGFWHVTFAEQFIDNTEDSLVLLNAFGQHVDETPKLSDTNDDLHSWQRYPDGSENWVYALPSTEGAVNVPEYESPAILAIVLVFTTLLILQSKQNVTQHRRH